jgi:hypothetical protein
MKMRAMQASSQNPAFGSVVMPVLNGLSQQARHEVRLAFWDVSSDSPPLLH